MELQRLFASIQHAAGGKALGLARLLYVRTDPGSTLV